MAAGKDVTANVPGAKLRIVKGMGHYIPELLVPLPVEEIGEHCRPAEDAAHGRPRRAAGGAP